MMRNIFKLAAVLALVGGFGVASTAGTATKTTCSLSVSPQKADSKMTKSGGGGKGRGSSSTTVTFERNVKYKATASFYGPAPEKAVMKVWYIGMGDGGKELIEVGHEERQLELNEKGRAVVELISPTTKLTKVKTTTQSGGNSRNGGGSSSTKSTMSGERVTGCVIQVHADGELMKSWVSDSRWSKAARDASFAFEMIDPKAAKKK